ncbi:hypothetical protein VTL71DRAFT_3484 [Oculimacula yallundae]|uniref:NAD(P)-binding protein n=1 Tax=Oculimacula yallundae TaxID=86028 RepID=A0ABR4C7A2_9HELO
MTFKPEDLPGLKGKVFIVTGGNSGIGYHTVAQLASHGAHVYLCSRSTSNGDSAITSIKALHPTLDLKISLLQIDLASLSSVVAAAKKFLTLETSLHGLVNNAGIMGTAFQMTEDGHEAQWQTNYLSHWVLTTHLLPLMLKTSQGLPPGAVRIVNLTSSGHLNAPKIGIDFDDLALKEGGPWPRYGQSKLANILHAKTLHTLYGPGSPSAVSGKGEIWTTSVHPGVVETNLATAVEGSTFSTAVSVMRCLGLMYSAEKGAWSSLFCVAGTDMTKEQCGGYIDVHGRLGEPWWVSGKAKDERLAEKLEEWSKETMGREGWIESAAMS